MISYLPFTYISERNAADIHRLFGPMRIYTPDEAQVPDLMQAAEAKGHIDLRAVASIPPGSMLPAVRDYKQWAELHQGNLADMAGFFKATQGRFPMMDETNPSQIKSQIRNMEGKDRAGDDQDPLFQAALFLCLAQEYDLQQEILRRQMCSVQTMEQGMMARLSGERDLDVESELKPTMPQTAADLEPGGYMTEARIEAWARLALQDVQPPPAFLTGSPAVMDHLGNTFPEAEAMTSSQVCDTVSGLSAQERCEVLRQLSEDPAANSGGGAATPSDFADGTDQLVFYRLRDMPPRVMLQQLCRTGSMERSPSDRHAGPRHTLIGFMALS